MKQQNPQNFCVLKTKTKTKPKNIDNMKIK